MNRSEVFIAVAVADNGVIGNAGALPWHIPADLRRFKALTMGMPMVMGRKTFESLPGLLPGRRHIVLTRDTSWSEDGAEVAHSLEDALGLANSPHIAVVGGAEIYAMFLHRADRIELTEIHASPAGDTVFPHFDPSEWRETFREAHGAEGKLPPFDFVTLVRKS
ncbi:MAG TPA: dihydrofolate reductase [Novosphingobium sp.]|nr:dihydrofolate reductase [Novosphingobium sp.]